MTKETLGQAKILVLARDYKSYARFVRNYNLHGQCRYIIEEQDLQGYQKGEYKLVEYGCWRDNNFYNHPGMEEKIRQARINAKEVVEVL